MRHLLPPFPSPLFPSPSLPFPFLPLPLLPLPLLPLPLLPLPLLPLLLCPLARLPPLCLPLSLPPRFPPHFSPHFPPSLSVSFCPISFHLRLCSFNFSSSLHSRYCVGQSESSAPCSSQSVVTRKYLTAAESLRRSGAAAVRYISHRLSGYEDTDDYLDTQFRLLREDYVGTLRNGIKEFKNNIGAWGMRFGGTIVYRNLSLISPKLSRDGLTYLIG